MTDDRTRILAAEVARDVEEAAQAAIDAIPDYLGTKHQPTPQGSARLTFQEPA